MPTRPQGMLFDFGGTLVVEESFDPRAANAALLARAAVRPPHLDLDAVMERATAVSAQVAARRDQYQLETPWPALTRLVHDYFGTRFAEPMAELEMLFWRSSVVTSPMPGAREALDALHRAGVRLGVVSNSSFGQEVIRYELARHGLAERMAFIMVSAEYAVRKPHPLLFDTAAAKLGLAPADIWFVGDRLDTDIAGAAGAGMTPILFCPPTNPPPPAGTATVTGWTELLRLFQQAVG